MLLYIGIRIGRVISGFSNGVPWDGGSLLLEDGTFFLLLEDNSTELELG